MIAKEKKENEQKYEETFHQWEYTDNEYTQAKMLNITGDKGDAI